MLGLTREPNAKLADLHQASVDITTHITHTHT